MKRKSSDYLIYLIGLAGIVATSSTYANEQDNDSIKMLAMARDWTTFQRSTWLYEAFPDATFVRIVIPRAPGCPGDERPNVQVTQSDKGHPGRMKKRLEVIQEIVRTCKN